MDHDDQLQRDLEQVSGSPQLANQIKESLRRLTDGAAGPELAEMARDVLDGRTTLRTVARSSAYADQMTDAIGRYQRWRAELTPEERDQLITDTRHRIYGDNGSAKSSAGTETARTNPS